MTNGASRKRREPSTACTAMKPDSRHIARFGRSDCIWGHLGLALMNAI
jgi:hypothetical protein